MAWNKGKVCGYCSCVKFFYLFKIKNIDRRIILLCDTKFHAYAHYVHDWHFSQVWKLFSSRSIVVFLKFIVSKKNILVWEKGTEKSCEMIKDHDATRVEFWKSFHSAPKSMGDKGKGVSDVLSRNYNVLAIEDVRSLGFEA